MWRMCNFGREVRKGEENRLVGDENKWRSGLSELPTASFRPGQGGLDLRAEKALPRLKGSSMLFYNVLRGGCRKGNDVGRK